MQYRYAQQLWLFAACTLGAGALAAAPPAQAQPPEVEQHTEEIVEQAPDDDETTWELSAGGTLNTGNTRSWNVSGGSLFRLVRGRHAVGAEATLNYGQADLQPLDDDDSYEDTVRNFNGRARYDLFLTDVDALFTAVSVRWDTFAGLNPRIQIQPGYLRELIDEEKHRLWLEVGYDFTYDNFHPDPLIDEETGNVLAGNQKVHSARLFAGYDNRLNEAVRFRTGAELLPNVQEGEDVRFNWESTLRSTLADALQLELRFTLRFDNVPVEGRVKTDTVSQLNLIYALMGRDG